MAMARADVAGLIPLRFSRSVNEGKGGLVSRPIRFCRATIGFRAAMALGSCKVSTNTARE